MFTFSCKLQKRSGVYTSAVPMPFASRHADSFWSFLPHPLYYFLSRSVIKTL